MLAKIEKLKHHQDAARKTLWVTSIVLILLLIIFGIGLWASVSDNLSRDQLEVALFERAEYHAPRLQETARLAVWEAMPTYQRLATEKLSDIRPQLQSSAERELQAMPSRLQQRLTGQIETLQQELEQSLSQQIEDRFGELPTEQIDRLTQVFADELEDAGQSLQADLQNRYEQQASRLEQVLKKFELADAESVDPQELEFRLIESTALLVAYLSRNPDELPDTGALPLGDILPGSEDSEDGNTRGGNDNE
jgi:hypothetical protein